MAMILTGSDHSLLTIMVRRLPEGVWLATSEDIPGLVVETDTREEMIDLAPELALDLMESEGRPLDRRGQKFAFIFEPN